MYNIEQWRNKGGHGGPYGRKTDILQGAHANKGPLQIKGPYTDKGPHSQRAHTYNGPIQTKDPYRRCVIPIHTKGLLQTI